MFRFFKKQKQVGDAENKLSRLSVNDASLQNYKDEAQKELQYLIEVMNDHQKDHELFR